MRFKELTAILEESIVSRRFYPIKRVRGPGIGAKPMEEAKYSKLSGRG